MPNWCYTQANIQSKKAEKIYEELKKATSTYSDPEIWDGDTAWFGYLLTHIGIDTETRNCRGYVIDIDYDHNRNEIIVEMETAWTSMVDVVEDFARHYDPEATVTYYAMECGMCLYWTNVPTLVGEYAFESQIEGEQYEFVSIDEIREWNIYEKGE